MSTAFRFTLGCRLERSHRHFSHLMAIHPLGYVNVEGDAGDRDLIERSLAHLRHIGTGHWSGWSFPWAALIACRARRTNMGPLHAAFLHRPSGAAKHLAGER